MRALALASIVVFASSCSPRTAALPSTPDSTPPASAAASPAVRPATSAGDEGCNRGDATPALDASKVTGHSFTRGLGPRAEEKATLADGTPVRVQHLGCEHYVERYTFTLAKAHAPEDAAFWVARAKELVTALPLTAEHAPARDAWLAALATAAPLGTPMPLPALPATLELEARRSGSGSELDLVYDVSL